LPPAADGDDGFSPSFLPSPSDTPSPSDLVPPRPVFVPVMVPVPASTRPLVEPAVAATQYVPMKPAIADDDVVALLSGTMSEAQLDALLRQHPAVREYFAAKADEPAASVTTEIEGLGDEVLSLAPALATQLAPELSHGEVARILASVAETECRDEPHAYVADLAAAVLERRRRLKK